MEHDDDAISAFMEVPAGAEDLDEHEDTFAGESEFHSDGGVAEQAADESQLPLRIEESWTCTWGGVRECCREDKVKAALQPHLDRWIGKKVSENIGRRILRAGYGEVKVQCRSWKDPFPDRKRHCNGSASTTFFVEFAS